MKIVESGVENVPDEIQRFAKSFGVQTGPDEEPELMWLPDERTDAWEDDGRNVQWDGGSDMDSIPDFEHNDYLPDIPEEAFAEVGARKLTRQ